MENGHRLTPEEWEAEKKLKLSKRLLYILRYGAEKEGLRIYEGGYVKLEDLMRVPIMKFTKIEDAKNLMTESVGYRGTARFEQKTENGDLLVRASYGRRMERNPNHEDSNVPRLLEMCLAKVCDNLDDYDLEGFPDEYLLNIMIHRLRRQKRLNNKSFRVLLTYTIEDLDLGYVYLTEGTIKLVGQRCPNLKVLNLRECGYLVTDHMLEMLLKKIPKLESLNLAGCHHLTDRTINAVCKNLRHIQQLNLSRVQEISEAAIIKLLLKCPTLVHLDIYDNPNISAQGRVKIQEIWAQTGRDLTVLLDGLDVVIETKPETNPSLSLCLAGAGEFW